MSVKKAFEKSYPAPVFITKIRSLNYLKFLTNIMKIM